MIPRHRVLLVEDDYETAKEIKDILVSLEMDCAHAATADEVEPLLNLGGYCVALLDLHVKATPASIAARIETGETILRNLRGRYPGRNSKGNHLFQIIVMSGIAKERDDVIELMQRGASDFLAKPFTENRKTVSVAILQCLRHSGRDSHDACSLIDPQATRRIDAVASEWAGSTAPAKVLMRLRVTGVAQGRLVTIEVNGASKGVQPSVLRVLLALIVGRAHSEGGWVERSVFEQKGSGANGVTRLRKAFADSTIVESDGNGSCRLSPAVVIDDLDLTSLARIEDARIRSFVAELKDSWGNLAKGSR